MKFEDIEFLEVDEVLELHADALARYTPGSIAGAKDLGGLEAAVMAARAGYYSSVAEIAAVYAHLIGGAHHFHDGNKRAGIEAAIMFLGINGHPVVRTLSDQLMVDLVTGVISRTEVAATLAWACGGDQPIDP